MEPAKINPDNSESALTSIHETYTLPCTPAQSAGEVDKIMVDNFLQTLSEVAMAIAARKAQVLPGPEVK